MPKLKKRQPLRQYDLWGNPIEVKARPAKTDGLIPAIFEGRDVRMMIRDGQLWLVAIDVCRSVEAGNPSQTIARLYADEKGVQIVDTPGGRQEVTIINEAGLYHLLMTARKRKGEEHPIVTRFKRWVTHEVLPSIRKTGTYSVPRKSEGRVEMTQRRLGCDPKTAKARCDQIDANKRMHSRMEGERAIPNHFKANHNATYRGEFNGQEAADLRERLGVSDSPLNHMESVPLSINTHSKTLAEKYIAAHKIPLKDQPEIFERFARDVTTTGLSILGEGHVLGYRDHPSRGLVIDVLPTLAAL